MRTIWLVGESIPRKEDGTVREVATAESLPNRLVPLDPRHGVFPNFVTKPLFAAAYVLSETQKDLSALFGQFSSIVDHQKLRCFNLFEDRPTRSKKSSQKQSPQTQSNVDSFTIDGALHCRIETFDAKNDLWLVFGHQTNFGLLNWLFDRSRCSFTRDDIKSFSNRIARINCGAGQPAPLRANSPLSARLGYLHKLCTGSKQELCLETIINAYENSCRYDKAKTLQILRSIVPLMHNEGYQDGSNPTGNAQSHFVQHACANTQPLPLYWKVMGRAIAARLQGQFVE
jgi:hypothetical protein